MAEERWRGVTGSELLPLVRAGGNRVPQAVRGERFLQTGSAMRHTRDRRHER
jgi:hypothetical protein